MRFSTRMCAVVLALAMTVGCTSAWLSTFDGYLKVAAPMLIQILDIVALARGTAVNSQLIAKINSDSAALNKLADSVNSAAAADVQGTCAQFNLSVQTFAGDLAAIEELAQISDTTKKQQVDAVLSIAQQLVLEIEAPIQACQVAPTSQVAMAKLQASVYKISKPEDVVRRFNAVVDSKHRIHLHNRMVRALSLGKLQ
jgi:hypothetical protein